MPVMVARGFTGVSQVLCANDKSAKPSKAKGKLGKDLSTKLKTLQKLQNRAARIVTSSPFDTPAAPLSQRLGWPSVERLINREISTMVFKSLNDLAPENLGNIFSRLSELHTRVLRNTKCNLAVPKMRTAYCQKSFAFRGADTWNKLDSE